MFSIERLDRETSRLQELLRLIQTNKYKADTVWNNFCMEMNKEKRPAPRKYFHKHPKTISNSSSEILTPNITTHVPKYVTKAKSANTIKFTEPVYDITDNEEDWDTRRDSIESTDVVTIRDDAFKRSSKHKCEIDKNVKFSTINSAKNAMNKQIGVVSKKSSKELRPRDEVAEKDNFEAKTQGIIDKCMHCMEDIRMQFDVGITPPDGLNDLERRKKRSSEFASRFSRNYLYQLNRQLSDIKKLLHPSSARISNQNSYVIKQKITSSYQTILQGLQAYLSHLPKSTTVGIPDKIKELLKEIASLCDMHRSYSSTDLNCNVKSNELLDVFEVRSRCLIDKIDEYYSTASVISLLQQSQSKFSLLESSKARKKNNMKSRYSMYSGITTRKDVYWKRAVAALARKKYNVQSKYKTAYFKHRPPIEKETIIKPVVKTKTMERRSSTSIKLKPPIDDDNIKTMIQMEKEKYQRSAIKGNDGTVAAINDGSLQVIEKLVERLKEEDKVRFYRCVLKLNG
ncbi:hypothetical protein QE152_g9127 [Popillia japonica]|uniref:Uncharacterized protein n=1 Tax=Popillia japonica TaxID=7064 RepID=A0AAW1LZK6_POPJA